VQMPRRSVRSYGVISATRPRACTSAPWARAQLELP
jgi:hypothetical protein